MASQFLGMDPDEVKSLATQFNNAASQINTIVHTITSVLSSTNWQGPDQQQFSSDWNSTHVANLRTVAQVLEQEQQYLLTKIQQQEQASAASGTAV